MLASAGNRTRAARALHHAGMAGEDSTTEPPMLLKNGAISLVLFQIFPLILSGWNRHYHPVEEV